MDKIENQRVRKQQLYRDFVENPKSIVPRTYDDDYPEIKPIVIDPVIIPLDIVPDDIDPKIKPVVIDPLIEPIVIDPVIEPEIDPYTIIEDLFESNLIIDSNLKT